jgi:LTXXQ motif family protein
MLTAAQERNWQMKMLASAAVLLALAANALAAPPSGRGPMMGQGPMMADDRGGMGMMRGMCPMGMGRHTEGALAFLKTELKITPAQNSAWEEFAAAYREAKGQGGQMPMMPGGMMMGGGKDAPPMPDRMAQHSKMMEDHLAQMKKMQGPVSKLYASLNAEQKRTADELLPMFMMCRMM